jgi:Ni,Fe-hydrogenase III large subunit
MRKDSIMARFVKREQQELVGQAIGAIQLSTLFEMDGRTYAIYTDVKENKTILADPPSELGEEIGLLLKGLEAAPGSQIELDTKSRVEGYGVFTFPYGPVTSGIPEAGGFKLVTYGERIVKVIPLVNFKKRGVERKVVGMKPDDAMLLLERSAGNFSASYSTCFAAAIEDELGLKVPQAAKWIRAVAMELERIYNHLYVFSREADAASQNVATYQTNALKERVLRLNAKYFGHRYLFGFNKIGGVRSAAYELLISPDGSRDLFGSIKEIRREFSKIVEYFLSSRIFMDRLQNTARLRKEDALILGAVGPVARGSGIDCDARLAFPIEPYNDIFVDIQTETAEDTMARVMVRINEITASTTILQELLDKMPTDGFEAKESGSSSPSSVSYSDFSICRVESPSGDLIQAVKIDDAQNIKSLHIRPASLANWLSFAKSLEGNVFTDFQFSFESFGLCYADSDR